MLNTHRHLVTDTIDHIASQTSLSAVSAGFVAAMAKLGFTALGINGLPWPEKGADPVILTESTPTGFRENYIEERFYAVDHICAHGRTASEPFRYDEAPYASKKSRHHARFMQALKSYQMDRGVVVPFGRPVSMPACIWLAGKDPELHADAMVAVQSISLFAASKAHALGTTARAAPDPRP